MYGEVACWPVGSIRFGIDPLSMYTNGAEINQVQWFRSKPDWIVIDFDNKLHLLKVYGSTSAMEVSIWGGRLHFREVGEQIDATVIDATVSLLKTEFVNKFQESAKRIFPLCKSYLLINEFVESRSQIKCGLVIMLLLLQTAHLLVNLIAW
ncbi:hypothetical protein Tco_0400557 [Tanacetum coccineum]